MERGGGPVAGDGAKGLESKLRIGPECRQGGEVSCGTRGARQVLHASDVRSSKEFDQVQNLFPAHQNLRRKDEERRRHFNRPEGRTENARRTEVRRGVTVEGAESLL